MTIINGDAMDVLRLKAPFPWMGGKSTVAHIIWERLGDVVNYVEPFAGSLAVLLRRPLPFRGPETVNDINGWLCNVWRSLAADPEATAAAADWQISELDLHARGDAIFYRDDWYKERGYESVQAFIEWLRADPGHYDPLIAGWWIWGQSSWIGGDWGRKECRSLPRLGTAGQGVNRSRPHLGDAGQGVNRSRPNLGNAGQGIRDYFEQLAERLRKVRVCCGDWSRVCGPSVTFKHRLTGVFLDPPYGVPDRDRCYGADDDFTVSASVREWAIEQGKNPLMRVCLAGYDTEHDMPADWDLVQWKAVGGYASQRKNGKNKNCERERLWFSPHCKRPRQEDLFA